MHPIIYDVAVSLDGFISGPSGDISKFAQTGPVVDDYVSRLSGYKTALMGRCTYEFGYAHGLKPGQTPYPQMDTIVCSQSLTLPKDSEVTIWRSVDRQTILDLKSTSKGPIYLCGGGQFAGWLLDQNLIDRLILKRAPCVYSSGTQLFGGAKTSPSFERIGVKTYDNGYLLEDLDL